MIFYCRHQGVRAEVRLRVKVAVGESVRMELSVGITGRVKERVRV